MQLTFEHGKPQEEFEGLLSDTKILGDGFIVGYICPPSAYTKSCDWTVVLAIVWFKGHKLMRINGAYPFCDETSAINFVANRWNFILENFNLTRINNENTENER